MGGFCVFGIVVQSAFQKCILLENALKWFFSDFFFIFDISASKPSKSTKKHKFDVFSNETRFWNAHPKAEATPLSNTTRW